MESNTGYLNVCAVIQKYIDQAISVNNYYDPSKYEEGNLPISVIMEDIFYHYSMGGKTMYYANTADGKTDVDTAEVEKQETIVYKDSIKMEELPVESPEKIHTEEVKKSNSLSFIAVEEDSRSGCVDGACTL
jgi:ribonucleotide reductase alpha subunit